MAIEMCDDLLHCYNQTDIIFSLFCAFISCYYLFEEVEHRFDVIFVERNAATNEFEQCQSQLIRVSLSDKTNLYSKNYFSSKKETNFRLFLSSVSLQVTHNRSPVK